MTRQYTPIECASYDAFELACVKGERLLFRTSGGQLAGVPVNLGIENSAEVLVIRRDDGVETRLRLDEILSMTP